MKTIRLFSIAMMTLMLVACQNNKKETTENDSVTETENTSQTTMAKTAEAVMNAKSGSDVDGTVSFKQMDNGDIMMTLSLTGVEPGRHAVHIHENGDCSADDGTSAGGHWNPTSEDHGEWGDGEHHLGDIGNFEVGDDGVATMTFTTDKWSMNDADTNNILGKSVIVHAKADDFTSQPSGAAGARIACGVIQ